MTRVVAVGLVGALALALVAGAPAGPTGAAVAASAEHPPDPPTDRIGWEGGYWHNESIAVDPSDGLDDAEMDAYVSRTMARVEYVRQQEFTADVPVSVQSRASYREQAADRGTNTSHSAWNDQVWEALWIVGESASANAKIGDVYGTSVAGFYSPADDEIKIITPDPAHPVITHATLSHELTHALQDQHHDLTDPAYTGQTQDGDLAVNGLVEGEANYVQAVYERRCGGAWSCVDVRSGGSGGGGSGDGPNPGILLTVLQPYSDGPVWIADRLDRGGWGAVDAAWADPPVSSEQIIHLTEESPEAVTVSDRARNGWTDFPDQGVNGTDTVGEASIFVMFWYQSAYHGADAVDPSGLQQTESPYDSYDYESEPSAGWAGDAVRPYHKETANGTAYGYVWKTRWDTERDAREFRDAYVAVLDAHDARTVNASTYVVPGGDWADAFRVVREGRTVTVVNAPTAAALDDVRPGSAPPPGATEEPPLGSQPGFTAPVALLALALAVALAAALRRRVA
ncbi:MAG: Hvo_1808 family surface protein [Halobacteriaceae archaeon]